MDEALARFREEYVIILSSNAKVLTPQKVYDAIIEVYKAQLKDFHFIRNSLEKTLDGHQDQIKNIVSDRIDKLVPSQIEIKDKFNKFAEKMATFSLIGVETSIKNLQESFLVVHEIVQNQISSNNDTKKDEHKSFGSNPSQSSKGSGSHKGAKGSKDDQKKGKKAGKKKDGKYENIIDDGYNKQLAEEIVKVCVESLGEVRIYFKNGMFNLLNKEVIENYSIVKLERVISLMNDKDDFTRMRKAELARRLVEALRETKTIEELERLVKLMDLIIEQPGRDGYGGGYHECGSGGGSYGGGCFKLQVALVADPVGALQPVMQPLIHRKVTTNPSNSLNLERQPVNETLGVDIESSGSNSSDNQVEVVVVKERVRENRDSPPSDDVCPICFGEFTVPVKTNCGHWFCGTVSGVRDVELGIEILLW
ncbi:hypothetical protein AgCh_001083 [Apium graveolens]